MSDREKAIWAFFAPLFQTMIIVTIAHGMQFSIEAFLAVIVWYLARMDYRDRWPS